MRPARRWLQEVARVGGVDHQTGPESSCVLFLVGVLSMMWPVNVKASKGARRATSSGRSGKVGAAPAEEVAAAAALGSPARETRRPRVAEGAGDELGAAELARHVADCLRQQRKVQSLSLDELAVKCGVSRAALSQIEGARTNPTLAVLWKIAVGLGIPFQQLLGTQTQKGPRVLRAGDGRPLRSADGQMESHLLTPGGADPGVEVYELRLVARGSYQSEAHSQGTTETVVVLTGALRMTVGGDVHELAAGDSIFFNADVPHSYESRSSHPTRCLNVIAYGRV